MRVVEQVIIAYLPVYSESSVYNSWCKKIVWWNWPFQKKRRKQKQPVSYTSILICKYNLRLGAQTDHHALCFYMQEFAFFNTFLVTMGLWFTPAIRFDMFVFNYCWLCCGLFGNALSLNIPSTTNNNNNCSTINHSLIILLKIIWFILILLNCVKQTLQIVTISSWDLFYSIPTFRWKKN